MSISKNSWKANMQSRKGHTAGWAAFSRKQQESEKAGTGSNLDHFPSILKGTSSGPAKTMATDYSSSTKSFASVVCPRAGFHLLQGRNRNSTLDGTSSIGHQDRQIPAEANLSPSTKSLRRNHSWADDQLVEDVLAAANNDVGQASLLLRAMALPDSKRGEIEFVAHKSAAVDVSNGKTKASSESTLSVPEPLFSVPIEPEWEEEDIYLSHRKDALRMMRMASQHSKAASNAFLRGDHISAHQLSSKAQEEWIAAEKLNRRAAEEILRIRNNGNDLWEIDLHGLHASEAVSALKEHLHKIETDISMNRSASSEELTKLGGGVPRSSSLSSAGIASKVPKIKAPSLRRPSVLSVITGSGNHSRGHAALPIAVRSFLIENGYRFEDTRPGVFDVRPKFRNK